MKKNVKQREIITPKTVSQHIEEEFRKSLEFRKTYGEEVARLSIDFVPRELSV